MKGSGATADAGAGHYVLVRLRGALPDLRPSEQRVARAALADPAGLASATISVVAERCHTSEATVSRLARALGFASYGDFRLALTQAATLEQAGATDGLVPSGDIAEGEPLAEIVAKIAYSDARAVEETARHLDLGQLDAAVTLVASAHRVDVYGVGASGFVADDLRQKLHRIGRMAFSWSERHAATTSAALLDERDVVVAISHTGRTADTIDAVDVAKAQGAQVIVVTNYAASPLASRGDVVLLTAARETTFRSGATASRIAQLAIIDFLFVGVASRSFSASVDALERTRAAVAGRRR